jgi:hypothetical protein
MNTDKKNAPTSLPRLGSAARRVIDHWVSLGGKMPHGERRDDYRRRILKRFGFMSPDRSVWILEPQWMALVPKVFDPLSKQFYYVRS